MTDKAERLHHVWCKPQEVFFARIDEFGGWPVGNMYVSFAHSDERECKFGNEYLRTGWWTTIVNCDEYYWWKISEQRKTKFENELRRQIGAQLSHYVKTADFFNISSPSVSAEHAKNG